MPTAPARAPWPDLGGPSKQDGLPSFLGMRTERWFNVLVLGGAVLGQACGNGQEGPPSQRGGSSSGSGGAGSAGAGDGGSASSNAGTGGVNSSGAGDAGGGSAAGGESASGSGGIGSSGASSGGTGSSGASSGGEGGAGSGEELQCRLDSKGRGHPNDPCGCPCCWAVDCLNTDVVCCTGFCRSANDGASCCAQ